MLPPIRYPLPTLLLLLVLGLVTWGGERLTRPLRSALAERVRRTVEGPPIPSSTRPQVVAGPIVRRALLLRDGVEAADRPGGRPTETIRLRMFVDVYDVWPLRGEPDFYRVGNRRPIGWVEAREVLPWSTRLVVRPAEKPPAPGQPPRAAEGTSPGAPTSLPVLSWTPDSVEVAEWDAALPWQRVARRARVPNAGLGPERWGAWLSREELLVLLRRVLGPQPREPDSVLRLRAVLGRLADERPFGEADLAEARRALPGPALAGGAARAEAASEALARINEGWQPEASWAGFSFQFVPLSALP